MTPTDASPSPNKPARLIIIDGNALVHRAFHALPPLAAPDGRITNAVYGFTSILIKIIKDLQPDYLAATFDLAGPTFRHEEFAEYKIHRDKAPDELYAQIPLVKDMLSAFGVPIFEMAGYEADDVIGTLATLSKKIPSLEAIIATGDLDTLQLVDKKKVMVFTMRKGLTDTILYDEDAVWARYELRPDQLNDYKGLKGDPSDNIPGVPGIGEKTAGSLMKQFGSLESLYTAIEGKDPKVTAKETGLSVKLIEKLLENKAQALFSKKLSTIITDLSIDFSIHQAEWKNHFNQSKVEQLCKDLGFFTLVKRIGELGGGHQQSAGTKPEKAHQPELLGQAKAHEDHLFFVLNDGQELTRAIVEDPKRLIIGHDIKNALKPLISQGVAIRCSLFDTKIATYLLHPDLKDYDFHKIYYAEFKQEADDVSDISDCLWHLKAQLEEQLKAAKLDKLFHEIELPLIPILATMELSGIMVDREAIERLLISSNHELIQLETDIYRLAGGPFNINSPQQLGDVLFNKLGISGKVRRTGGGALSTAAPQLEKLKDSHEIIPLVLSYRELQKLKTTYIEPFPKLIDPTDQRIHTTYNQAGAGTGRLSSQDPNLQNIPTKTKLGQEFRRAFIPAPDYEIVTFDYSQLELRLAAHIAHDPKMIEAFKNGEDIHTRTAAEIFGVAPDQVTKDMRRQAKVLNFGIMYGMGSLGFAQAAGVDRNRAKDFISKYFTEFAGIAAYMEAMKAKAHKDGYVETLFGRKRALPDIFSTMPQLKAGAERAAINHPIQGTAADLMKLAMIDVYRYVEDVAPSTQVRMLLQVHDELVCEIAVDQVETIAHQIQITMESVRQLDVPLIVDVKHGTNWQDVTPLAL